MPVNNRSKLLGFPKSYAFIVGINHYPKLNAHLKSAVNDAKALAKALKDRQGFDHVELLIEAVPSDEPAEQAAEQAALAEGMEGVQVQYLADGATFRDMLNRLQDPELEPKIQSEDCIVFYYAGHGKPGEFEEGPKGFLLPSDAQPEMAMLKNDSLVAMEEVFQALKTLDCHHTLLILDCCFAGKFRYADQSRMGRLWTANMPLYEERFERFKREKAWQVLVSAGPNQTAADWLGKRQESANGIHSPFAEGLLEALEGKAELSEDGKKLGDGVLTSQELFLYLWNKVERLTKDGHLGDKSQYPDLFPMSNHEGGQFIFFDPNNKLNFAERVLRNPYQGLSAFEQEKSDLFFGREAVVQDMLEHLTENRLLVVTAPSGSGKSSVVKAGLYPSLLQWRDKEGQKPWAESELLVLRPGTHPWKGQPLEGNPTRDFFNGLEPLLTRLEKGKKQLLLVDQYEELFTEGAATEEVAAFENKLSELYQTAEKQQLKIILTLRSDYEWLLAKSGFGAHFWDLDQIHRFLYRLRPMSMDELRDALVSPALAELYEFETDKLVETILAEVGHAPGALPMLSFLMSQFYEVTNKDERVFTMPVYKELGGVVGALSKYADQTYMELGETSLDHQRVMQKLMLRMVKLNNGNLGRRRVYVRAYAGSAGILLNEFDYLDHLDDMVEEVLQILEEKQLILCGTDRIGVYYEPVHEALIQHWGMCKQWIADFGVENLSLQRQLWQAVEDSVNKVDRKPTKGEQGNGVNNFSRLWDTNPKLLQVLEEVAQAAEVYCNGQRDQMLEEALPHVPAEEQAAFRKTWAAAEVEGHLPSLDSLILFGYSDKLLALMLEKGDHWLNEEEVNFIQQSWEKRIEDILQLKKERDEAIEAKKRAQAAAKASESRELYPMDNTLAFNLAVAAYRLWPSAQSKSAIRDIISNKESMFYELSYGEHTDDVNEVASSPSGELIATASKDKTAKIWRMDGKCMQTFTGHEDAVDCIAFSPDETMILTGSLDHTLKLWRLDGKLLRTFNGHEGHIRSVAFSPNGQEILSGSADNTAKLWTLDGEEILSIRIEGKEPFVRSVCFSPDGSKILTAAYFARLWTREGKPLHVFKGHTSWVRTAKFSPDGERILVGRADGVLKLWTLDGILITEFAGHVNPILSVCFLPDGQSCLSASVDGTVCLWAIDGRLLKTLRGHNDILLSVTTTPDGRTILTGGADNTVKKWMLEDSLLHTFSDGETKMTTVAFAPDGETILAGGTGGTLLQFTIAGELLHSFKGHTDTVGSTAFSPDGKMLVSGSFDKTAKIWNLKGKVLATCEKEGHTDQIHGVVFSPDARMIATASWDGTAKLWNTKGKLLHTFSNDSVKVTSVTFSPDGQMLLMGSDDNLAKLWSLDGQLLHSLVGHTDSVSGVAFSRDGEYIATASWDRTAKLWSKTGELLCDFVGHKDYVNSVVFSPDRKFILTASGDSRAKIWSITGECIRDFEGHKAFIIDVDISPDGKTFLTASFDGTAKLWQDNFADWESDEKLWARVCKLNENQKKKYLIDWEY